MIFYFSGTGNTQWIATQIANAQNQKLIPIGEEVVKAGNSFHYTLEPGEKIGFLFPVYSWAPPKIVLDFIRRITFSNYHTNYLYFICSCGDDIGLTKEVFLKSIHRKGWECHAGFSVTMPNNYVLMKGFNTDSPEVEQKKLSESVSVVEQINGIVQSETKNVYQCTTGKFPFIKTKIINPLFNKYQITAKPFYATEDCISCKRCEKVCPVGNVVVKENSKPVWGEFCTSCLACYHICPTYAVQYGSITKDKGHYFNPNIRKKINL